MLLVRTVEMIDLVVDVDYDYICIKLWSNMVTPSSILQDSPTPNVTSLPW